MQLAVEIVGLDQFLVDDSDVVGVVEACLVYAAELFDIPEQETIYVVIKITTASEIIELHRQYFQDSSITDVITFPAGEDIEEDSHLGDIAICYEVAVEQASDQQHSVVRELVFLSLHGLLHLLGYDDQTKESRAEMLDLQEQLIADYESYSGQSIP